MGIDSTHEQYDEMLEEWQIVRACASGPRRVKKLGVKILPPPGAREVGGVLIYDKARYAAYLKRAIYTNITGRTEDGLTGAAFRLPAKIELPSGLEYLEENADGTGLSLMQMAKQSFRDVLETGRDGFLVDYPEIEEGLTKEQIDAIGARATIKRYAAESITDWDEQTIGGINVVTMIKLLETYDDSEEEFTKDIKKQYRILRLNLDQNSEFPGYTQEVYRDGVGGGQKQIKDSTGRVFQFIPFFFFGAESNDPNVDEPPLSSIAHVGVGHFRNSADLEESSHIAGQAMYHIDIGTMDVAEWEKLHPNGIAVGSTTAIQTQGGKVEVVQPSPNQLPDELMKRKEEQMLKLGARMIEQRGQAETATAARIDATGENSVLADIVENLEEAIQKCVEWCGMFMGVDRPAVIELNRKFFDDTIEPQMLMAVMQGYTGGLLPKRIALGAYQKAGIIKEDEDLDLIAGEVEAESPLTTTAVQGPVVE